MMEKLLVLQRLPTFLFPPLWKYIVYGFNLGCALLWMPKLDCFSSAGPSGTEHERSEGMRTREKMSRFLYHYYTGAAPKAKHLRFGRQTGCCLRRAAVMFYQPLRPCQSMAGVFPNIFNTQREHFWLGGNGLRAKIGRRLSGRVNHQRPFVCVFFTPCRELQEQRRRLLSHQRKLFYIWPRQETARQERQRKKGASVYPTSGITVQQVKCEIRGARLCACVPFAEALIYALDDMTAARAG